jgi:hypothetical protein
MMKKKPTGFQGLIEETATKLAKIYHRQHDELERNLAIGRCLQARLSGPQTSASKASAGQHGRRFIIRLTHRVNLRELGLGLRKLYHCYRLARLGFPPAVWAKIKTAGLSWRQVRDLTRLLGRGDDNDRAKALATLVEALPPKPTAAGKREFQAWLDRQLNPGRRLPEDARFIVVDRVTGRVFSSKLKRLEKAKRLVKRWRKEDAHNSVVAVEVTLRPR